MHELVAMPGRACVWRCRYECKHHPENCARVSFVSHAGAPGLGPLTVRKDLVKFKDGFRTRCAYLPCANPAGWACVLHLRSCRRQTRHETVRASISWDLLCSTLHCTPRVIHGADNVAGAAQGLLPQRVYASVCGVNNGATSRAGGERVNGCSPAGELCGSCPGHL